MLTMIQVYLTQKVWERQKIIYNLLMLKTILILTSTSEVSECSKTIYKVPKFC